MSFLRPKRRRWLVLLFGISCLLNLFLVMLIVHRPDRQPMLDNRQDVGNRRGDEDGGARKESRPARVETEGLPPGYQMILRGHPGSISALCFSPDHSRLGVTTDLGYVTVWDLTTRKVVWETHIPGRDQGFGMIDTLAFSPHGDRLAYAVRGGSSLRDSFTLHVRDLGAARERTLRDDAKAQEVGGCSGLNFSPDGRIIAVGGHAGVALFDLESEKVVATLRAKRHVYCGRMSFSANGTYLLVASLPRAALFDLRSGRMTMDLEYGSPQHTAPCHVAHSPDGGRMAMSWRDNSVRLFDASGGRALASIQEGLGSGFSDGSCWVAFTPDGLSVLTASRDADLSRIFVRRRSSADGSLLNKVEIVQPGGTCPYVYPRLFAADGARMALVGLQQETRFVPEPGMGWIEVHEGVVAIYDTSGLFDPVRVPGTAVPKSSAEMTAPWNAAPANRLTHTSATCPSPVIERKA